MVRRNELSKQGTTTRPNINRDEKKALKELREDNTRVIQSADKGVAMVVMDKEDYIRKAKDMLSQLKYKTILADPTTRQKNKLINLLKTIKAEGGISEKTYRKLYPIGEGSPTFYGLPKNTNQGSSDIHYFK